MGPVIGNPGGEFAEVRHHQDHHALPDITLISQPVAEVREKVGAGGRSVEISIPHRPPKIADTHLPPGEGFPQREAGSELAWVEGKHGDTGASAFLKQTAQAKIPVEIMGLLDDQPLHRVVRR